MNPNAARRPQQRTAATRTRKGSEDGLPYTDLDLRCWKDEDSDILLESLWLFPNRDRRGPHARDYHGNFVPQIPYQVLRRFTRPGEVVVDLFSGSGTTLIECCHLGRHGIGVELQEEVNRMARERIALASNPLDVQWKLLTGDSRGTAIRRRVLGVLEEWGVPKAHHVILHPPYWDIILFSDDPEGGDLSTAPTEQKFYEQFETVVANAVEILMPGRFMTLVIGDKYHKGEWIPLGFGCMEACRRAGLRLKSLNVKDIQGNERGKGLATNLWKYRALKGGFYLFKHEYVMIFQKPLA